VMPGSVAVGEAAEQIKAKHPDVSVAELQAQDASKGVLYSATWDPAFSSTLLSAIARRRRFRGLKGELIGGHTRAFRGIWGERHPDLGPALLNSEQGNTLINFGDRFLLKLYRRVEPGIHPDPEMCAFLTDRAFPYVPALAGTIEYRAADAEPTVVA